MGERQGGNAGGSGGVHVGVLSWRLASEVVSYRWISLVGKKNQHTFVRLFVFKVGLR